MHQRIDVDMNISMGKSILLLAVFTALATAALAFVERQTRPDIERNRELQATRIVQEVLPGIDYTNRPGLDYLTLTDAELLGTAEPLRAYIARRDDQPLAIAITVVAANGYVAPIRLLVGIAADGRVLSVRALEHRETPGLGDKIDVEKTDWINSFNELMATEATTADWALRRDGGRFEHISGATITSRAVTNAVRNALLYFVDKSPLTSAEQASADAEELAGVELVGEPD